MTTSDKLKYPAFMDARTVIEKLGRQRVMIALDVSSAQVSNKLSDGQFPAIWFNALDQLAAEDGWKLSRDLFAWKQTRDAA